MMSRGWVSLAVLIAASVLRAEEYPLSPEMALLERDTASADYRATLPPMLVTDLAAEWQRAVNPDDAMNFAEGHGGIDKVLADSRLKAAYERRDRIGKNFLAVMRGEYERRKLKAPFDQEGAVTLTAPKGSGRSVAGAGDLSVVHPNDEAAHQWYRFRGPSGQGTVDDPNVPIRWSATENIVWKTRLPGRGNSSPVIWNDRIFLTFADDKGTVRSMLCVDRDSGQVRWRRDLKVETIERMVRDKNGFASATPAVDGKQAYVFFGNLGVVCFDFEGNQKWRTDLGKFDGTWGPGASTILYKDLVILNQDQSRPSASLTVALDRNNGSVVWREDRPASMGWCTPMVFSVAEAGRDEMIFASNERLLGVDPATGKGLWSCAGPTREPIPSVVMGNGLIFGTSGRNGPTLAVRPGGEGDVTGSRLVWSVLRGGPHVPSPALAAGRIFLINDHGILTCLDATSGATILQRRMGGKFSASPIVAGNRIYLSNEDGLTTVIRTDGDLDVVAENKLGEPILASFATADGRFFIRAPQTLYCVGGK
ncbi:MAG TPA: PQQ-binding-like beta-propeller repeat protein [Verrucomicrobiae bacterium]|nr:PQQ-binding-like beta-propeller repeat protein [Verrucomicrobiae bacterium]